jgi:hypothetical protein
VRDREDAIEHGERTLPGLRSRLPLLLGGDRGDDGVHHRLELLEAVDLARCRRADRQSARSLEDARAHVHELTSRGREYLGQRLWRQCPGDLELAGGLTERGREARESFGDLSEMPGEVFRVRCLGHGSNRF